MKKKKTHGLHQFMNNFKEARLLNKIFESISFSDHDSPITKKITCYLSCICGQINTIFRYGISLLCLYIKN